VRKYERADGIVEVPEASIPPPLPAVRPVQRPEGRGKGKQTGRMYEFGVHGYCRRITYNTSDGVTLQFTITTTVKAAVYSSG
jgi:hypothetical protein